MSRLEGGCLCGRIRYHTEQTPRATIQCHCRNCQKQSGSAFSINLALKMDAVAVDKSLLSCFQDQGDSGNPVFRYFCGNCGSPLFSGNADLTGTAVLKAGSLDDCSAVKPGLSIWEASRQPWVPLCEDVLHADQAPPAR